MMMASNQPPSSGQNRWTLRHIRLSTIIDVPPVANRCCLENCLSVECPGDFLVARFPAGETI